MSVDTASKACIADAGIVADNGCLSGLNPSPLIDAVNNHGLTFEILVSMILLLQVTMNDTGQSILLVDRI